MHSDALRCTHMQSDACLLFGRRLGRPRRLRLRRTLLERLFKLLVELVLRSLAALRSPCVPCVRAMKHLRHQGRLQRYRPTMQ